MALPAAGGKAPIRKAEIALLRAIPSSGSDANGKRSPLWAKPSFRNICTGPVPITASNLFAGLSKAVRLAGKGLPLGPGARP
jgi:hypothetical protein